MLWQGILEGLLDGVLILTQQGEWVYGNQDARRICQQLQPDQGSLVPPLAIWQVCQVLLDNQELSSNETIVLEAEIQQPETAVRLRVRWLSLEDQPYLMVLLEDRQLSQQRRAAAEVQKYGLTPRQAEVWLLRRSGYSYRAIATRLYISLHTVKQHLKEIYARQRQLKEGLEVWG